MILRKMAADMEVPMSYVELIAISASHRYKTYRIRKRTGGFRDIAHPAKELKGLQRWLAINVFSRLPVHESVYSYKAGLGIRDHAELHKRHNYLLRIDIKDFFPSITAKNVAQLLYENRERLSPRLTSDDLISICRLVCRYGRLTIGAPSSPAISNAVLYQFDRHWTTECKLLGVTYSRYADDIYFSTNLPNVLANIYADISQDLSERDWPKLSINRKKVVFTSRKHNRNVTGLILTSDRRISIGHKKKRWIRSQIFKFVNGQLSASEISYLRGYLSYVRSVEPHLLTKLRKKYGAQVIREIESLQPTTRKTIR